MSNKLNSNGLTEHEDQERNIQRLTCNSFIDYEYIIMHHNEALKVTFTILNL